MATSFFEFKALDNKGKEIDLSQYKGKPVLVVNTASKCGFTPQYEGLQKIYAERAEKGLVVLGFPCDQFGNQEPGSDDEIAGFCQVNFGVTFPLMKKVEVNGQKAHPLFSWLKTRSSGMLQKLTGSDIKWNFTKFLVSPDGSTVTRFAPTTKPEEIAKVIDKQLEAR